MSEAKLEAGNSYVGLAASENAIHFVWSGGGSALHRRLVRTGTAWNFEAIRDSRARGAWHDNGPGIAVRGDDEIPRPYAYGKLWGYRRRRPDLEC